VGSNPTQSMDVCVCIGSGLATVSSPVQGVLPTLPTVLGLRNWSETKRFIDAPCSKVGAAWKREMILNWNRLGANPLLLRRKSLVTKILLSVATLWN
jgi:hypothetical protein